MRLSAPFSLNEKGVEILINKLACSRLYPPYIIDLSKVKFIDPIGMIGILEIGRFLLSEGRTPDLILPVDDEVIKYMERMDFFKHIIPIFGEIPTDILESHYLRSSKSDVLLEITPIVHNKDIHHVVGKVKERAYQVLSTHLGYNKKAVIGFIVALSEVCQNIVEHSQSTGFVGIQKYSFKKKLVRNIVKIAVSDIGIGIKESLSPRYKSRYPLLWSDIIAIEEALLKGASRFEDEGRGQGLSTVRKFIKKWDGQISIRSGRAKYSIFPSWSNGTSKISDLPFFPGTQISILLPELKP